MDEAVSGAFSGEKDVLAPGEEFNGYVVERKLGAGGLGTVWLARHHMLDTLFAVKVLDPDVAEEQPDYVKRFVREAKLATKIRHPNLVAVHDAGYDAAKGVYFLVMDYVKGDTLRDVIAFGGAQPEKEAVRIILQVADVLAAAQCFGMVHRDLKPENIMLTKEGVVKLLDLGVAKVSGGLDSLKTQTNAVFGTPAYISPEQAIDSSTVDARADVYSLGVILFELLTGRRPYTGDDPMETLKQLLDSSPLPDVRTVNGKVSQKVAETVARMCAKRLEDRIASPKDLLETFARIGYALPAASGSEIAAEAAPEGEDGPSVVDLVAGLSTKPADKSLELETQDVEIQEFISRLKRRKRRRWLLVGICVLALLAASLLLILLR
ncbi:MAG: serine/threonine protein kinase [Kiritimatiellae bacterium]|nr:serine/threonine protein kinase [Kiritimatiellia bacterium]